MNTTLRAAPAVRVTVATFASPIGPLTAGATAAGICHLSFGDEAAGEPGTTDLLKHLGDELADYFAGGRRGFTVPLALRGTAFQKQVWAALVQIPFGETRSYKDIAAAVGSPAAVRAVGAANGRNPVAVVVPCHRVIAHDGSLGGYGGGRERKEFLLALERGR